ncbi:unnamed protein product [Cylindrotheca closterium]|uniref:N-acetyltransferase domain-containing protein n=1 Tax=Cylindrotheca closterium TaxID=2856 RepID=A0AAD2PWA9_9STRA|nr:unnamed protein product [Cylindrotheca closterium]
MSKAFLQSRPWHHVNILLVWKVVILIVICDHGDYRQGDGRCASNLYAHALLSVPSSSRVSTAARASSDNGGASTPILYRNGRAGDELFIAPVMAKELMNPFGISHKNNLIVAEDKATGKRVGWAQIRSMGYAGIETSSKFVDDEDSSSNFRRKVQSLDNIGQELDDEILDDFERDPVEFPNGLASLPWTKEYREASQAASDRQKRREERRQAELKRRPQLWELSSVYVIPEYRKRGIGSELVQGVLQRNKYSLRPGKEVYALTLAKTVLWYQRLGFDIEPVPPSSMALEIAAGSVITGLIGEELVCIKATLAD